MTTSKQTLRQRLRARRQVLPATQQRRNSQALLKRLGRHPLFVNSHSIAFYLANDGEADPDPLLLLAHQAGKRCYLPVIQADLSLRFVRYRPGQTLIKNRFGIAEPCGRRGQVTTRRLDAIIMPLVGFDRRGGRLGMGGGFYDRSLQSSADRHTGSGPLLVGLAHSFQEVDQLELQCWDVRLDVIATEKEIIRT